MIPVLLAGGLVAITGFFQPALGHEWYSGKFNEKGESCCGDRDCEPVPDRDVRLARTGYVLKVGDQEILVPFSRVQNSPDENFHRCIWGEEVKCFFAPPMGS